MLTRLNSLAVGTKLWAVVGLLIALIVGFTAVYFTQSQQSIRFSQEEIWGNEYIAELKPVLINLQKHRGTVNAIIGGDRSREAALPPIRDALNTQFAALKDVDAEIADALELGDRLTQIERQWKQLEARNNAGKTQDAVYMEHVRVVEQVIDLISYVGDTSNLILDPELDSYYLMENVVVRAANVLENSGRIRSLGENIVNANGFMTTEQRDQLTEFKLRLAIAFDGSINALTTAGDNNPEVAAALMNTIAELERAGGQAASNIDAVLEQRFTGSPREFFDGMTAVIDANVAAFDASNQLLAELLTVRVNNETQALYTVLVGVGVLLTLSIALAAYVLRSVSGRLVEVEGYFEGIQAGNLNQTIEITVQDNIGRLMQSLVSMQTQLRERTEADQRILTENTRIRRALDQASASVMLANADDEIIYMNEAADRLFQEAEEDFKTHFGSFDASTLMGKKMDVFHKNPAHQHSIVGGLTQVHNAEVKVGTKTLSLALVPVRDDQGERIGTAVEWRDRTQEAEAEAEVQRALESALAGDLAFRVEESGKTGFYEVAAKGLNQIMGGVGSIIDDTARVATALAKGDLTQSIETEYRGSFGRMAKAVNESGQQMASIVQQITQSAEQVRAGAEEIAQGNSDLSHRTEEQASSLEETASSMEQMTGLVRQSAENAQQANDLASSVRDRAVEGGEVVQRAVEAMSAINESSKQISDIITVIDEIAFQTNLLALNAAVEAARAGEQGRGFAVVAGEVRSLAQRSAEAAKEIKELIRDSSTKVQDGTALVNESGETLNSLVSAIADVAGRVTEISQAVQEQSSGIDEVNTAVAQMDEMTQQNAALVEQASAAGEAMAQQSRQMVQTVGYFTLAQGQTSVAPPSPSIKPKPEPRATAPASASDDDWAEF